MDFVYCRKRNDKRIAALDVASTNPDFTDEVHIILKSNYCCPVCSPDPIGI
jgi:hypothetical protein